MVLFHRMDNCNKYLFRAVILGMVQFVLCIILDIKVCKRWNGPTHHFSTSPDDFYRQNWPFLLLDTSLNVGLCQHFLSHNITRFTKKCMENIEKGKSRNSTHKNLALTSFSEKKDDQGEAKVFYIGKLRQSYQATAPQFNSPKLGTDYFQ